MYLCCICMQSSYGILYPLEPPSSLTFYSQGPKTPFFAPLLFCPEDASSSPSSTIHCHSHRHHRHHSITSSVRFSPLPWNFWSTVISWGNCQRVPAVLWINVPPLLYAGTLRYFQVLWGTSWYLRYWVLGQLFEDGSSCCSLHSCATVIVRRYLSPEEPRSGGKTVTTQCYGKWLFRWSMFPKKLTNVLINRLWPKLVNIP